MIDHPDDAYQRKLQHRITELRNQLEEISGGNFLLGGMAEGMTREAEIAFLEQVIAYERAPATTWHAKLKEAGYDMPDPAALSEAEIGLEVWQVIQRLSELRAFLYNTNHLSDRELYQHLYDILLSAEARDMPLSEDSACHFDLVGSGSEDDLAIWLRYYADAEERERWQADDPADPLPPHEEPPYQRDHLLPTRTVDDAPLHRYIDRLIDADWYDPGAPIHFSAERTEAELEKVPFFIAARALLETLREMGEAKATAKLGDLPRSLVKQVYPLLPLTPRERDSLEACNKVFNEEDLPLLNQVRSACEYARLLRKYKGNFVLTKMGGSLLDPARAGELYRHLFLAFFRRVSLAYFDGCAALPGIQATLAVILWRMRMVAEDWISCEDLQTQTLLPTVLDEIAGCRRSYAPPWQDLEIRLWRHLRTFGLLESDVDHEATGDAITGYRITPLFLRFLRFDPLDAS